eukprot:sb/3461051/
MRYRNTIYKCCTTEPCSLPYSIIVEHELYKSEEPYTKLECDMKCELYYHQTCIKSLPKWNIDEPCLTPDCTGFVRRHYENGQLKRESKIVPPPKEKKPRERVRTCSEKGKKKAKKRNNSVPTPSPPTPPPRTPTPTLAEEEAPSSSSTPEEEATFTGDDMVEFYGTLLIYVGDEAPGVFITDAVMKFSYIYKFLKIDTFTDTLWGEIGVESLICKDGKLFVFLFLHPGRPSTRPPSSVVVLFQLGSRPPSSVLAMVPMNSMTYGRTPAAGQPVGIQFVPVLMCLPPRHPPPPLPPGTGEVPKPSGEGNLNPAAREFTPPPAPSNPRNLPPRLQQQQPVSPAFRASVPAAGQMVSNRLLQQAAEALYPSQVGSPVISPASSVQIGSPIITGPGPSYAETRALRERVVNLEAELEEIKRTKSVELDNYKTQLCQQMNTYTQLKAKTKQYKQEAKNSQDIIEEHARLQSELQQLTNKFEEERKTWLSERTGKSHDSKKLMLDLKLEIADLTKKYEEIKKQNSTLTAGNETLQKEVAELEDKAFSRERKVLDLKSQIETFTQHVCQLRQRETQERFNTCQLQLRIAFANCASQIRERSRMDNPERYKLSQWVDCQERVKAMIDENAFRYQEYASTFQHNPDRHVIFEGVPDCPPTESGVPLLPLQRYDDILLGKLAPELPEPHVPSSSSPPPDDDMMVLRNMMNNLQTPQASNLQTPQTSGTSSLQTPQAEGPSSGGDVGGFGDLLDDYVRTTTPPLSTLPSVVPQRSGPGSIGSSTGSGLRFNTCQLQLRIAFANCASQIRERSRMDNPERYKLSQWVDCQERVKAMIDENAFRYQEYASTFQHNPDRHVIFEGVPDCPPTESGVPLLPLQRYDDILLGKLAPELPEPHITSSSSPTPDEDMMVLRNMMNNLQTPQPSNLQTPQTSGTRSLQTPQAEGPSSGGDVGGFGDLLDDYVRTTTPPLSTLPSVVPQRSGPGSIGSSTGSGLSAERAAKGRSRGRGAANPPPAGIPPMGRAKPGLSHTTRRPGAAPGNKLNASLPSEPSSRPAMFSPPPTNPPPSTGMFSPPHSAPPTTTHPPTGIPSSGAVRGPATTMPPSGGAGPSRGPTTTMPPSSGTGAIRGPTTSMPPSAGGTGPSRGPRKATDLMKQVGETFPFLNQRETMAYLKRIKEERKGQKVTPEVIFSRLEVLVRSDYPESTAESATPPAPSQKCVVYLDQEPTDTTNQNWLFRSRDWLVQPIRDQYFLIRSVPDLPDEMTPGRFACCTEYITVTRRFSPGLVKQDGGGPALKKANGTLILEPTDTTNQNSLFRSRDWLSANQGPVFPDLVGS